MIAPPTTRSPPRQPGNLLRRWSRKTVAGLVGPFQLIHQHRGLLWVLLRREIAGQTSGTVLGWVWIVAQPALQVLAFWFLLGVVLRVRMPSQVNFVDYFLMGMLPWFFVSNAIQRNLMVLTEFGALYQRSVFPIKLLPLIPLLFAGIIYALIWPVVASIMLGGAAPLLALVLVALITLWLIPVCYLVALVGLFARDARHLVPFLLTMTLFLTPILYMPQQLPESVRFLLALNPLADLMAIVHHLLQGMPITLGNVARPVILWLVLLAPAWTFFHRAEPHMREQL